MFTVREDKSGRPYCDENVIKNLKELLDVEIGVFTVAEESCKQIKELLKLDEATTEEELRGTRNAVVLFLSTVAESWARVGLNDQSCKVYRSISGITAVIDNELFGKGYGV